MVYGSPMNESSDGTITPTDVLQSTSDMLSVTNPSDEQITDVTVTIVGDAANYIQFSNGQTELDIGDIGQEQSSIFSCTIDAQA